MAPQHVVCICVCLNIFVFPIFVFLEKAWAGSHWDGSPGRKVIVRRTCNQLSLLENEDDNFLYSYPSDPSDPSDP